MSARAPLDVDLEDKLLYGLTPTRLAYVVVGLLIGFAAWSSHWAPALVRGLFAFAVVGAAAAAAWGRWRGRPVDGWAADMFRFVTANHRLSWSPPILALLRLRPSSIRSRATMVSRAISSYF